MKKEELFDLDDCYTYHLTDGITEYKLQINEVENGNWWWKLWIHDKYENCFNIFFFTDTGNWDVTAMLGSLFAHDPDIDRFLMGLKFVLEDCEECDGEGEVFIDTTMQCIKHASECCGGCGYNVECEDCEGIGTVKKI